ncbi:MAG: CPBP family intramembrane metalloprotease [Haliscomenobacter sp.]|nr:CPBP family intramembrane metalloprotease [Haliscomenobacter sp.]
MTLRSAFVKKHSDLFEAAGIAMVLIGFGFLSQRAFYGALLLLAVSAWALSRHIGDREETLAFFGLSAKIRRLPWWISAGIVTGMIAWLSFYIIPGREVPMPGLGWFALTAAGIGLAEEVVYRGFLYSLVKRYGPILAIVFTALAHTGYKLALLSPYQSVHLFSVLQWTLFAGIVLGGLRARSGSAWPAILNHVVLDVLVYGNGAKGPEWVW